MNMIGGGSKSWLAYETIHRLWRESQTTPDGQTRAGDDHYINFAYAVGELAREQLAEDLRRSLLARSEELAAAFTEPFIERLIDEAFTHDAMVKARPS